MIDVAVAAWWGVHIGGIWRKCAAQPRHRVDPSEGREWAAAQGCRPRRLGRRWTISGRRGHPVSPHRFHAEQIVVGAEPAAVLCEKRYHQVARQTWRGRGPAAGVTLGNGHERRSRRRDGTQERCRWEIRDPRVRGELQQDKFRALPPDNWRRRVPGSGRPLSATGIPPRRLASASSRRSRWGAPATGRRRSRTVKRFGHARLRRGATATSTPSSRRVVGAAVPLGSEGWMGSATAPIRRPHGWDVTTVPGRGRRRGSSPSHRSGQLGGFAEAVGGAATTRSRTGVRETFRAFEAITRSRWRPASGWTISTAGQDDSDTVLPCRAQWQARRVRRRCPNPPNPTHDRGAHMQISTVAGIYEGMKATRGNSRRCSQQSTQETAPGSRAALLPTPVSSSTTTGPST